VFTGLALVSLTGCNADDDDQSDDSGFVQLYNISANAPGVILSLDQGNEDSDDDFSTFAVSYPTSTGFLSSETGTFDMELSWQDGDDSDDLTLLHEGQLTVTQESVALVVVAEDVAALNVLTYQIAIEDDDTDDSDELFNLRFLNMQTAHERVDIYYSQANQTFNEAVLLQQSSYTQLSDNHKLSDDDYIFYLVAEDDSQPVYQSEAISFLVGYQYLLVVRNNTGAGSSPFTLDKLSRTNAAFEYPDADAEAQLQVYNGIVEHQLLPTYAGIVDVKITGIDSLVKFDALTLGEFSQATTMNLGDFSVNLTLPDSDNELLANHLLTLPANSDKTVFFYLHEEALDEDGDGDFDEDGDGYVDEFEITANSLVVENSQSQSIYTHAVQIINLIDDFDALQLFFVRHGETIETSTLSATATYIQPTETSLTNNTYKVYLIGQVDSSQLILASQEVIFDETTGAQFLILEENSGSPSGYQMNWREQKTAVD